MISWKTSPQKNAYSGLTHEFTVIIPASCKKIQILRWQHTVQKYSNKELCLFKIAVTSCLVSLWTCWCLGQHHYDHTVKKSQSRSHSKRKSCCSIETRRCQLEQTRAVKRKGLLTSRCYNSTLVDQSEERYWRDQINCSCAKKNQETIWCWKKLKMLCWLCHLIPTTR